MKKILIFDFSRVLLFPKDRNYKSGLNKLYDQLVGQKRGFSDSLRLNEPLLKELEKLELDKYIFTTGKVQNAPEIRDRLDSIFKQIFNVPMIGYAKRDIRAYLTLCGEIGVDPPQAMFIDDVPANVETATAAGLHAVVYEDNEQTLGLINQWLQ